MAADVDPLHLKTVVRRLIVGQLELIHIHVLGDSFTLRVDGATRARCFRQASRSLTRIYTHRLH